MNIIALLPMKAHSERVPNKNMKSFCGTPLYHAILKTLLNCKQIEYAVINTDSDIIEKDAKMHFDRVKVIKRPKEIRGDFISMNEIIKHDLSMLAGKHFLQTHSTNPLLTKNTIERSIKQYFDELDTYDSVFSVTQIKTRLYWKDGSAINHNPKELLRTQDLTPVFEENSCFYIFSKESFSKAGHNRIGIQPKMFKIDKIEGIDIDEPADFEIAEMLFAIRKNL